MGMVLRAAEGVDHANGAADGSHGLRDHHISLGHTEGRGIGGCIGICGHLGDRGGCAGGGLGLGRRAERLNDLMD